MDSKKRLIIQNNNFIELDSTFYMFELLAAVKVISNYLHHSFCYIWLYDFVITPSIWFLNSNFFFDMISNPTATNPFFSFCKQYFNLWFLRTLINVWNIKLCNIGRKDRPVTSAIINWKFAEIIDVLKLTSKAHFYSHFSK